jgi:hypothetical protein
LKTIRRSLSFSMENRCFIFNGGFPFACQEKRFVRGDQGVSYMERKGE